MRVEEIKELFADTGLHFRATEYIREEMWSKYRLNICNNLPQAILGAGVGCYSDSTHMKAISDGLKKEVEAVAAAKGIDMSKVDIKSAREVRFLQQHVILHCRILMPDVIRR